MEFESMFSYTLWLIQTLAHSQNFQQHVFIIILQTIKNVQTTQKYTHFFKYLCPVIFKYTF